MKKKIKKFFEIYIRLVQKILLFILLVILYILGFGLTKIFTFVFNVKYLSKKFVSKNTFWEKIEDDQTKESFFHQI